MVTEAHKASSIRDEANVIPTTLLLLLQGLTVDVRDGMLHEHTVAVDEISITMEDEVTVQCMIRAGNEDFKRIMELKVERKDSMTTKS